MAAPTPVLVKNSRRGWIRHGLNHLDVYATSAATDNWADQVIIDLSTAFTETPYPLGIKLHSIYTKVDGTCTGLSWEIDFATDLPVCSVISPTLNIGETYKWKQGLKSPTSEMWDNCATTWTATTNVTAADETTIVVPDTTDATPTSQKLTLAAGFSTGKIAYITGATDSGDEWEGVSFYIRSSVALQPSDLAFCTDESTVLASPDETLNIPFAMEADKWYFVKLYFTGATTARDVISSHGLWANRDFGAAVLYIDNIRFIKHSQQFPSLQSGSALGSPYGDLVCTTVGIANTDVIQASLDFEWVWSDDSLR